MKILIWSHSPLLGTGLAKGAHHLGKGLSEKHKIYILSQFYSGKPLEVDGYTVLPTPSGSTGVELIMYYYNRYRPDLIITWLNWHSVGDIKVPNVVYYTPIESQIVPPFFRDWISSRIVVPASQFSRDLLNKDFYIPLGVDTEIYKPLPRIEDKFVVGFVGMNERRKMLDRLVKAFDIFAKDKDDVLLSLHTTPNPIDPTQWGWDLNHLLRRFDLSGKVRITGHVPYALSDVELCKLYNSFSVYASTSSAEGFGFPVLEAQSCGVPCIVSDNTSHTELVKGHGELVPCDDSIIAGFGEELMLVNVDEFVKRLNKLYYDRKLLKSYSKDSRKFASQYDWKVIINKWDDFLNRLCLKVPATNSR